MMVSWTSPLTNTEVFLIISSAVVVPENRARSCAWQKAFIFSLLSSMLLRREGARLGAVEGPQFVP